MNTGSIPGPMLGSASGSAGDVKGVDSPPRAAGGLGSPPLYDGQKVYFDRKGYAVVWREGKNKKVHLLEWEKHNGAKPKGFDIHHKDEDKANWTIGNLELMTPTDHQRHHAGWKKTNGEWSHKSCTACLRLLPLSDYYPRKGLTPSARCKPCHNEATKQWPAANRERRREIANAYYHRNKHHA